MPMTPDDLVAAGPWQTGSPAEEGQYLVHYEQHGEQGVSVLRYFRATGWHTPTDAFTVLQYAPVHSPDE